MKKLKIPIESIIIDEDLYPRDKWDNEKVNAYRLNINELPPILVQKAENLLIDGMHRLLAHRLEERKEIDAEYLDIPKEQILWEATKRNSEHGLQLSLTEKKRLARYFFENNDVLKKDIAAILAVSSAAVTQWTRDLQQEKDEELEKAIVDCYLACMTYEEIKSKLDTNDPKISSTLKKLKDKFLKSPYIPDSLQVFNVWNFSKLDTQYGLKGAKGQIPGQIVENILYYFTEPFDTIIDPMAGGGTTQDVCKTMYRRWRAYDIKPLRPDIKKHDITTDFSNEVNDGDLIFLDPPYYDLAFDQFKTLEDFYQFITKLAKDSYMALKKGGLVAFITCDRTKKEYECLTHKCYNIFIKTKFECIQRISAPLGTSSANASEVVSAKKNKKLLGRDRILYIFRK